MVLYKRPDLSRCMARVQSMLGMSDAESAHAIGIYAKDFRDIRRRKRQPDGREFDLIDRFIREMVEVHDAYDVIFAPVEDYDVYEMARTSLRIACGIPRKS